MDTSYPVVLEVRPPVRFERLQLVLRFAILVVIGIVGVSLGWFGWALYLLLPLVAAVAISARGPERYLGEVGPPLGRVLGWAIAFFAYMMLVVDRFPTSLDDPAVRTTIHPTGQPTVGSALSRWLTTLPTALVFLLLGIFSGLLAFCGVAFILLTETMPEAVLRFQTGMVRWNARLLAYHASLVQEYPPFTLGEPTGDRHAHAMP